VDLHVSSVPVTSDADPDAHRSHHPRHFASPKGTLPTMKPPKSVPKRADAALHGAIAGSLFMLRQLMRDSIMCLVSNLTPKRRAVVTGRRLGSSC